MIAQNNDLLLRLLKVRVVVNGRYIYTLHAKQPIVIDLNAQQAQLVITNGFHCSPQLEIPLQPASSGYFLVSCALNNNLLAAGAMLLGVFYLVGLLSDLWAVRLLSFLPLLFFLYRYYINRHCFLVMKPL